jgi:hypothetical protein
VNGGQLPATPEVRLQSIPAERVALVDLLDRLLAGGVVLSGDIVLSLSGVDLVQISLRAVIQSIGEVAQPVDRGAHSDDA